MILQGIKSESSNCCNSMQNFEFYRYCISLKKWNKTELLSENFEILTLGDFGQKVSKWLILGIFALFGKIFNFLLDHVAAIGQQIY